MIFNAESLNIYTLGGEAVSYSLKDIHTLALQVTPENVGLLSLEFEAGLRYERNGSPFFTFKGQRDVEREGLEFLVSVVHVTDWIVVLWDELHVFRDKEFRHTFSFDNAADHLMGKETPGGFGITSGEVDPNGTSITPVPDGFDQTSKIS